MRVIAAIIISFFVTTVVFYTVKFWGLSQPYADYKHPFYETTEVLIFKKPSFANIDHALTATTDNLYIDIANTKDQRMVIIPTNNDQSMDHTKDIRNKLYAEVEKDVLPLDKYKDHLHGRRIIFNINENAIAGHLIFTDNVKSLGLEKGDNILITTPYETLSKTIKELIPTFLFGTSQPEILKLKAMESLHLIEAATMRADVVIYPLKYYKQPFYTEKLQFELKRRFKRIIVGPIPASEVEEAKKLNPLGIVIQE
ncbi:hypothetical protein CIK05_14995 [Bdellovibrio sp. qaytius]|nr:hypothetical protein CIK05_14995 [Bdellovibrio sp. qaytius]